MYRQSKKCQQVKARIAKSIVVREQKRLKGVNTAPSHPTNLRKKSLQPAIT